MPGATLDILGGTELFWANGTSERRPVTFEPYEPQKVRLTTRDGRVFELDRPGVTRLAEPTATADHHHNGITHSGGAAHHHGARQRRPHHRVDRSRGGGCTYTYDAAGDLVSFTDRENQTSPFHLQRATTACGRSRTRAASTPIRNDYDDAGRSLRHPDAYGKTIEFDHDLAAHREVVTDRLGHSRMLEYDAARQRASARPTSGCHQTHLRRRRPLLSETDPLGQTTTYSYDAGRNLTSITDPLGNITRFTYDAQGRVLTATDPRGKVTTQQLRRAGKPAATTDALGHTHQHAYNPAAPADRDRCRRAVTTTYGTGSYLRSR